jgi:uracil-DNA glycosylase
VASEPAIFWDGSHTDEVLGGIALPAEAGHLRPAQRHLNGPSGRCLDAEYLAPLGLTRNDAWLCDLVPHTCLNPSQLAAIQREYEPRRARLGLPAVDLPHVPSRFTDAQRRHEILAEIKAARPSTIILLGDEPIRHFLAHYDGRRTWLADFSNTDEGYGALWPVTIDGCSYRILAVAHPRQVGGLGRHSGVWRHRHRAWTSRAAGLL